jgi:ABC-type transport system involved in multi-copper enzyme maturation permease subunit
MTPNPRSKGIWRGVVTLVLSAAAVGAGILLIMQGATNAQFAFAIGTVLLGGTFIVGTILCTGIARLVISAVLVGGLLVIGAILYPTTVIAVRGMLKKGILLRIDRRAGKAWIDPLAWARSNAQGKKSITSTIAIYCKLFFGGIDIYDAQSAKRLASYGPRQGIKIY